MKNLFFLILGLVIIFGSVFLYFERQVSEKISIKVVRINGASIVVELATTPESQSKGLSGRENLKDGRGMLFVFEKPDFYGFWMKDMHFAIDILWISGKNRIVGVVKQLSPDTFPQVFYPNEPVKYVLEVPSGFAEKSGIDIGSVVYFE